MKGRTRWPELEGTLQLRALFLLLTLAGGVALVVAFPSFDSFGARLAAMAGIGAVLAIVTDAALQARAYLHPRRIRTDPQGQTIVPLVSLLPHTVLMLCVAVAALSIGWQFGDEPISLSRRGQGPFIPLSVLAMAIAGFAVWGFAISLPLRRPVLLISSRGVETRGNRDPFSVGWSAIAEVQEINHRATFWSNRTRRANFIALRLHNGRTLRIPAEHVAGGAYDVLELLRQRDQEATTSPDEELPLVVAGGGKRVVAGWIVALVAAALAVAKAGDTPLMASEDPSRPRVASDAPADNGSTDWLEPPSSDEPATCRELLTFLPVLDDLAAGLEAPSAPDRPAPQAQRLLDTSAAMSTYSDDWVGVSHDLDVASQTLWAAQHSDATNQSSWEFLAENPPGLLRTVHEARAAIADECG
ncbi:hypothetical protein [Nocardioides sp.]|uniref:hypothetical protein n=1 Tax=Nocardioides sp. TaxID=35761 RepID=UPI002C40591E|nr:hypothetical protein [Nocardioides sp.]HSX68675.1 hypothetical protein [Nocardioides sp.]